MGKWTGECAEHRNAEECRWVQEGMGKHRRVWKTNWKLWKSGFHQPGREQAYHWCKGTLALEHEMMHLRLFWSHWPTMWFYYPSQMIVNHHQLVVSSFINTILPCPPHTFLSFTTILSCTLLLFSPQKYHSILTMTTALNHQFTAYDIKALVSKPCLYCFLQLNPSFVLPSPGPVTLSTPSSSANHRHRVMLFVLGKGMLHFSLFI